MHTQYLSKHSPLQKQWEKIGWQAHHGLCTPLASIHSEKSAGIGEYEDLFPLIDYCKSCNLNVVQLLPLNDSGLDPSPYNALSSTALHPIYLRLQSLPGIEKHKDLQRKIRKLITLNKKKRVAYTEVFQEKELILSEYLEREGEELSQETEYLDFLNRNPWLGYYGLFRSLKKQFNWTSWETWPAGVRIPSHDFISSFSKEKQNELHAVALTQFFCWKQISEAKKYAEKNGVFLKGDIPILLSPDSADVWFYRRLFNTSLSAGAPPDMYNEEGQNWGFPLYDWKEAASSKYGWWRERLSVASEFYHLFRIDHIVGFFRIWAIEEGRKACEGDFFPHEEKDFLRQGRRILKNLLHHCPMLPIGEDLGSIPNGVRRCMRDLGICGTKVLRWERNWEKKGIFLEPSSYPSLSMSTVSTHDSEPLRLWWKNFPKESKEYAKFFGLQYQKNLGANEHYRILEHAHKSNSLFHINLIQEYTNLFPELSWKNLCDERINVPGTISPNNWTYRHRASIEEWMEHESLKTLIEGLTRSQ